jgi:hypothetical protein
VSYLIEIPTSISEDGLRIAAMTSIDAAVDSYYPQWLVVKDLNTEEIRQTFDLIDPDLSLKLVSPYHCRNNLSACIPEILQRVQAANAMLAKDQWRPFPCISSRPERMGPGCELLSELHFELQGPRLIISRGERRIVTRFMPQWSPAYHKPGCKGLIDIHLESVAFDPETGLFVISLGFVSIGEGGGECAAPRWDFHPIRLPMFRREALQKRDGGAP